jgi:hypothetical protein
VVDEDVARGPDFDFKIEDHNPYPTIEEAWGPDFDLHIDDHNPNGDSCVSISDSTEDDFGFKLQDGQRAIGMKTSCDSLRRDARRQKREDQAFRIQSSRYVSRLLTSELGRRFDPRYVSQVDVSHFCEVFAGIAHAQSLLVAAQVAEALKTTDAEDFTLATARPQDILPYTFCCGCGYGLTMTGGIGPWWPACTRCGHLSCGNRTGHACYDFEGGTCHCCWGAEVTS